MNKKNTPYHTDEDDDDRGQTGQGGHIEFREFIASKQHLRDDQLPPEDKRRLMNEHQDVHKARVQKQVELAKQREAVKEGKIALQTYRQGLQGHGQRIGFKNHPLSNTVQFSGMDNSMNPLPNENTADNNPELRNELELKHRLQNQPKNTPKFNPRPQFR